MSLRLRLVGALLFAVVLAVSAGTLSHLAEVSARLEGDLGAQSSRVVASIRTELEQTAAVLDEELATALDPRGSTARSLASGRVEARFLSAQARLQQGRLEILKVLASDGTILSSGHWPASFGALDPLVSTYRAEPGPLARVLDESTPQGSAPSLQRWAWARWGGREICVVAGRFLDEATLERLRARVGADLISLCRNVDGHPACVSVRGGSLVGEAPIEPTDADAAARLILVRLRLGSANAADAPVLVVGVDRSPIDRVRAGIVRRAILVGLASIVFAMALGVFLATRIVRPIEGLASAAARLARGDLSVRVDETGGGGGGREVHELVDAFNRMAAEIERSQTKLRQAERVAAWQEIARGLAHELKNPLTPILGAMDVVRKARKLNRPDFDDILEEQASAVVEEVMRLKDLSDAFARFARLPDKKPEPLRMEQVVDHAAALYAGEGTSVVVERRYAEDLPLVVADRTQIGTVVTNLVKNGVEAMAGTGTLTLTLRRTRLRDVAAPQDHLESPLVDAVELMVEDTGPGIAKEIEERLFTPYVTTKGSRGTGLGLALAHRIVVEHGGVIEADNRQGGGARFVVRLPVAGLALAASHSSSTSSIPRAPGAPV